MMRLFAKVWVSKDWLDTEKEVLQMLVKQLAKYNQMYKNKMDT